jgi:hypothetical protein
MKSANLVLAAVLTLVWSGTTAHAETAKELLHVCELLQRGMHVEGTQVFLPPSSDVAQCWGFMLAVQQYSILADHDGKTLLGACPKPDTTTTQVLRIFIKYARAHPEKLGQPAAAVAFNAMADAFPCNEQREQ